MWNKQTRIGKHSKAHKTKNQSIIHFKEEVMNAILEQLSKFGVVPVVVLNEVKDAEPLAKALCEGGLPCAEVTSSLK